MFQKLHRIVGNLNAKVPNGCKLFLEKYMQIVTKTDVKTVLK